MTDWGDWGVHFVMCQLCDEMYSLLDVLIGL